MWKIFLSFYAVFGVLTLCLLVDSAWERQPSGRRKRVESNLGIAINFGGIMGLLAALLGAVYWLFRWLADHPNLAGLLILLVFAVGFIALAFKALIAVLDFIRGP